jgi:hypothetical protein
MGTTGNYHLDRFEDNFGAYEDEMVEPQPDLYNPSYGMVESQTYLCEAGCGEELDWLGSVCRECWRYFNGE